MEISAIWALSEQPVIFFLGVGSRNSLWYDLYVLYIVEIGRYTIHYSKNSLWYDLYVLYIVEKGQMFYSLF